MPHGTGIGVYPYGEVGDARENDEVSSTYEGRHLTFDETEITGHEHTWPTKGHPVVVGESIVGIALNTAAAITDFVTIDTEGIWLQSVVALNPAAVAVVAGDELFIIQKGKIKITKVVDNNEVLLAVLKPGDIFGEMAILENKPRSASAISFGESECLVVSKDNFEGMVKKNPQLGTKLITLLSERIWKAYRQLANILISDPVGRMYDMLLTVVEENRVTIAHNVPYTFEFGPDELIKMVGLPAEEGNVLIQKLFENKKFKLQDRKIIVTDIEELAKQVGFYKKMDLLERKRQKLVSNTSG